MTSSCIVDRLPQPLGSLCALALTSRSGSCMSMSGDVTSHWHAMKLQTELTRMVLNILICLAHSFMLMSNLHHGWRISFCTKKTVNGSLFYSLIYTCTIIAPTMLVLIRSKLHLWASWRGMLVNTYPTGVRWAVCGRGRVDGTERKAVDVSP